VSEPWIDPPSENERDDEERQADEDARWHEIDQQIDEERGA